jgi:uncharacterized protein
VKSWLAVAFVLATGGLAWLALADRLPSGPERFYLLLPPTCLGLFLSWSAPSRQLLRKQARVVALGVGIAFLFCYAVACFAAQSLTLGPSSFPEILWAAYFLVSVGLVWAAVRWGVWSCLGRLAARIAPQGRAHALLTGPVAVAVHVAVITPYLVGVAYVHRLKLPPQSNPRELCQRPYEDVAFRTRDGLTIRGWFLPAQQVSERTLLVCHGLGGNRENFLGFVELADRLRANVLLFDFRGHGASDGHTVSLGLREKDDVLAAIAFLRTEHAAESWELIGLGVSMGSGALVLAAAEVEQPLQALILDSGMAYSLDLTDNVLRAFPQFVRPWLTGPGIPLASLHAGCRLEDLRPEHHVARVRAPVLVIHSLNDRLIPPEQGRRLYEHAAGPKEIFLAPTQAHADVYNRLRGEYLERVAAFVNRPRA